MIRNASQRVCGERHGAPRASAHSFSDVETAAPLVPFVSVVRNIGRPIGFRDLATMLRAWSLGREVAQKRLPGLRARSRRFTLRSSAKIRAGGIRSGGSGGV